MHANPSQLARIMGVSRQTIHAWAHKPGFPDPLPGTNVRNVWKVKKWAEENKKGTKND